MIFSYPVRTGHSNKTDKNGQIPYLPRLTCKTRKVYTRPHNEPKGITGGAGSFAIILEFFPTSRFADVLSCVAGMPREVAWAT